MRWTIFIVMAALVGCTDPAIDAEEAASGSSGGMMENGGETTPGTASLPETESHMERGMETESMTPGAVPEECDGFDNDLDGQVDEGGCACGGQMWCFAGPPAARNVGVCRDGVRECDSTREFAGPCMDSVGPSEEQCNGEDDDCDGTTDESCCDSDPNCRTTAETFVVGEQTTTRPVDFVMAIDNSGSMRDTIHQVESNLGSFSSRLAQAGIDYRFTLISALANRPNSQTTKMCVPEPMAGPNCSDNARFRHLDESVGSHSALSDFLQCSTQCGDNRAGGFSSFLRPGSLLQYIVVTDDEARLSWNDFRGQHSLNGYDDFIFHSIVGLNRGGCVADVGDQYIQGAQETGGQLLSICDGNWGNVLNVILDTTVTRIQGTFTLSEEPIEDSIQVFLVDANGRRPAMGWSYVPASKTIQFEQGSMPPIGTQIIVEYSVNN